MTALWNGIARYRSVALCLAATVAMIVAFPGAEAPIEIASSGPADGGAVIIGAEDGIGAIGSTDPGATQGTTSGTSGGPGATSGSGGTTASGGRQSKNCDPTTGRLAFPSVYSPPCVASVSENGGATSPGVTGGEIVVVRYDDLTDPTVATLLRAAGLSDEPEQVIQSYHDAIEMFQAMYETYGRRVRFINFQASAEVTDDTAARADAVRVATEYKPFAVIGGPSPFVDELANRGIVTITQLQRPQEYFERRSPYVFGTQMSSTQAFLHLAEYIGKRVAGKNAIHAGDAAMRERERTFGMIYLDTTEAVYSPGVDSLERELAKYGVELTDRVSYEGEISRAQEIARVVISRMKDNGVTSVLFSGDPIAPIFFTQEATNQGYYPEWIIPGGTLVDTNFFGRTYDANQWAHMFGISQLWAGVPDGVGEAHYQHQWFHGRPPAAANTYFILLQEIQLIFTGVHLAGPNLNPQTFQAGVFRFPVSGAGMITQVQKSWGSHGVWAFTDYTGFDSVTEVWWDPNELGEDEIGNRGRGMLQFVNGGRRYGPGDWPATEPAVFTKQGAVTGHATLPESDRFPTYPRPER